MSAELDLTRIREFDVIEHDPIPNAAIAPGVDRRYATFGPNSIADFHHARGERASNVDICRGMMAPDERDARRFALYAVSWAATKAMPVVARARSVSSGLISA
jgi:hypothetical protein